MEKRYRIFEPGRVEMDLLAEVAGKFRLGPDSPVSMLPYGQLPDGTLKIGAETRRLYFHFAVDGDCFVPGTELVKSSEEWKEAPVTRIISFGKCNVSCPYCKRDCQFLGDDGLPIIAQPVLLAEVVALCEGAVGRGEIVRFSGGDPVTFPTVTLAISEYLYRRYGVKTSIAHNGSGPAWARKMAPYLGSAAIDLKGVPEKIGGIMGIEAVRGELFYKNSLETQGALSRAGVLTDVRTPVFGDTSVDEMRRLAQDIYRVNDLRYTFWTWRQYKPVQGCDWSAPTRDGVIEMMKMVSRDIPALWLGIRAKWDKGGMIYVKAGEVRQKTADTLAVDMRDFGSGNLIEVAV